MVLHEWLAFYSAFFLNIHQSGVLTVLAWLVPHETTAISVQVLCTPYNHVPCYFRQSHICKMYVGLAVTGHLHFWQNDQDLLCATVVTWGWNGYRNKSQHRKSTLEKKILLPLLQGFKPATFQSGALTTELCPVSLTESPQDSQTQVISKCTFQNTSHIYINVLSSQSAKPIPTQTKNKICIMQSNTDFQRVRPFNINYYPC